jgi:hypothetical protein
MARVKYLASVSHTLKPSDVGIRTTHEVDVPVQHNASASQQAIGASSRIPMAPDVASPGQSDVARC